MKVVAINSSPNMDTGITNLILTSFLDGMSEVGAEVELFYTKSLKINPCQGDFSCWLKTPGECCQKDDMNMLIPLLSNADCWVFATPVYIDGLSAPMKNLLDRMIPLMHPLIEVRNEHCCHLLQKGVKGGTVVLVSNCGYWELDNFDPLIVHMKAVSRNFGREFSGALLRPHVGVMKRMMQKEGSLNNIFEAAKLAGHQLVRNGRMSDESLKIVSRALLPREEFVQTFNQSVQKKLDALEKK
jgi:multimeric flavodoxin WrbA